MYPNEQPRARIDRLMTEQEWVMREARRARARFLRQVVTGLARRAAAQAADTAHALLRMERRMFGHRALKH